MPVHISPDSALILADNQYNFAKSVGDSFRLGDALNNRASALYFKGFFREALNDFHNCLALALKNNDLDLINIVNIHIVIFMFMFNQ